MFRYGWLTITAEDLAVWRQFPEASFTLVNLPSAPDAPDMTATLRVPVAFNLF